MRPIVLTIAGSDPSGGAGIQADARAIEAAGGYAASVIAAITVQNTLGVRRVVPVAPDLVRDQLAAVLDDLDVAAVKAGMLAESPIVVVLAEALAARRPRPLVVDPVLASTGGVSLAAPGVAEALIEHLFPLAALVTPNVAEAETLSGCPIRGLADAEVAARRLVLRGARAVLVTGGHFADARATDLLVTAEQTRAFSGTHIDSRHTHGGGCTFASTIAVGLAHGLELAEAIVEAKGRIEAAIRRGWAVGAGRGPTDPEPARSER